MSLDAHMPGLRVICRFLLALFRIASVGARLENDMFADGCTHLRLSGLDAQEATVADGSSDSEGANSVIVDHAEWEPDSEPDWA